jgi:hypothetical protein
LRRVQVEVEGVKRCRQEDSSRGVMAPPPRWMVSKIVSKVRPLWGGVDVNHTYPAKDVDILPDHRRRMPDPRFGYGPLPLNLGVLPSLEVNDVHGVIDWLPRHDLAGQSEADRHSWVQRTLRKHAPSKNVGLVVHHGEGVRRPRHDRTRDLGPFEIGHGG